MKSPCATCEHLENNKLEKPCVDCKLPLEYADVTHNPYVASKHVVPDWHPVYAPLDRPHDAPIIMEEEDEDGLRTCRQCKIVKPLDEYSRCGPQRNFWLKTCKACSRANRGINGGRPKTATDEVSVEQQRERWRKANAKRRARKKAAKEEAMRLLNADAEKVRHAATTTR